MTGKVYTMKEMKGIVDYLKEKKLYREIKGRKMWMDYASSQLTTRTWQSLKETFLKRVLPDLHNPYYNLTIEEINSFRSGYDVSERNKNKLEIHTVSDDSDGQQCLPQTSNDSDKKQDENAAETEKSSKITLRNRYSADTVIVDTCYETAEDIQKDLESPMANKENGETKSLRDCITYSEPLTPMLQEVLDDFNSEAENEPEVSDRENQLQIVEQPDSENLENISNEVSKIVKDNQNDKLHNFESGSRELSPQKDLVPAAAVIETIEKQMDKSPAKAAQNSVSNSDENENSKASNKDDSDIFNSNDTVEKNGKANIIEDTSKNETAAIAQQAGNACEITNLTPTLPSAAGIHSNTIDASLPNNPEGLEKTSADITDDKANIKENKKSKLDMKKIETKSENETKKPDKIVDNDKTKSFEPISKLNEADNSKSKTNVTSKLGDIYEKPSTSKSNNNEDIIMTSDTDQRTDVNKSAETINPCLNNISLYNEQFNEIKYNSSTSSDVDKSNNKDSEITKDKNIEDKQEVVVLKSHTESDVEEVNVPPPKKRLRAGVAHANLEKEKVLADMFGFSSGASKLKYKKRLRHRRRTKSPPSQNNSESYSSEWTSESGSEVFVSAPRCKKSRLSKKYWKPPHARLHSISKSMFMMCGRNVYPIVKNGKIVKKFVTYETETESDEENFWKLKYMEEKKKTDELTKLLQEPGTLKASTSKAACEQPEKTATVANNDPPQESSNNNDVICLPDEDKNVESRKVYVPENIKINFKTKDDQEINLEGNWNQLQNALQHVVQVFHKELQPTSGSKASSASKISIPTDLLSITSVSQETLVDPETHEKVDKMESKIFKEIEEIDQMERKEPSVQSTTNITTRRGRRPTALSSSKSGSALKRIKNSEQQKDEGDQQNTTKDSTNNSSLHTTPDKNKTPTKRRRTPREVSTESMAKVIKRTRSSTAKLNTSNNGAGANDDEEIRYMLPEKNKKSQAMKAKEIKKSMNKTPKRKSSAIARRRFVESTQGYQDSDYSPIGNELRKKKKLKPAILRSKYSNRIRIKTRSQNSPFLYYDDSSCTEKKATNSTENIEVYKSEPFQILIKSCTQSVAARQRFNSINELGISILIDNKPIQCDSGPTNCDNGSSSQISLPLSPELSIVENLSISKELLNNTEEQLGIDEIKHPKVNTTTDCKQFSMSHVDASVPLMQQTCMIESCQETKKKESNHVQTNVTDSLLHRVGTFKIEDQSNLTDTLNAKLSDLLLESAKKKVRQNVEDKIDAMEVDVTNKPKPKKRSSTPRKRNGSQKSKQAIKIQNIIEKEHKQNFSKKGRKSCPPVIETIQTVPSVVDEMNISNLSIDNDVKSKGRKKKAVIKVKIVKPNKKSKLSTENTDDIIKDNITQSIICNDSGINNTIPGELLAVDESVNFNHNHTETCVTTNECLGESVELSESSLKSINDDLQTKDSIMPSQSMSSGANIDSLDFFSSDAQDVRSFYKHKEDIPKDSNTVHVSPSGTQPSSLITEDLSDELSSPVVLRDKWYLLNDDESTNLKLVNVHPTTNIDSCGSSLNQIFPVCCAVPDLSTITEMSKDNEDSNQRSADEY